MRLFKRKAAPAFAIDKSQGDPAAARLRGWLRQRDWPAVRDFFSRAVDPDDRSFYLSVCGDVEGVQDWIGQAVDAEPHSTLPLLVKGAHGIRWAWEARGALGAEHTQAEQFREFFKRLKMAENCLDEVVERNPDEVAAWACLVTSARGRQVDRDEAQRRFQAVVTRSRWHRHAHEQMLQYRCQKWYGSHDEM
ncbi:MAG: DUF4034 domain-containing protein, partial [Micromonosporaceae bacterium]